MGRKAIIERKTKETDILLELDLDGKGNCSICTSIPFFDHMLNLFARHANMNLKIEAAGDIDIDFHHTVEDIGICLGRALKEALGDKSGIVRYGHHMVPMDEALTSVTIDLSGRPYLVYNVKFPKRARIKAFDQDIVEDFLKAFIDNSMTTLHINLAYGRNIHHILESIFKGLGRVLKDAVAIDPNISGVMSTKGSL